MYPSDYLRMVITLIFNSLLCDFMYLLNFLKLKVY